MRQPKRTTALWTPRVYADTSVYGGVFDDEFAAASQAFFDRVRDGRLRLVMSTTLRDEIAEAPDSVQRLFDEMRLHGEFTETTGAALQLRQAYLERGIVAARWHTDALHVAMATVMGCSIVVSWNFKHIVNFQRIPLYNSVNLGFGYSSVAIYSPLEMMASEED